MAPRWSTRRVWRCASGCEGVPPGTGAVGKLRNDLYIACAAFWTAVSYWAPQYRRERTIGEPLEAIRNLRVWQRYVGPHWSS